MARYCDGDAAAFHDLYGIVAPKVHSYLVALTSNRAMADDLLQDAFLKVHQHRSVYVRNANPVPWIFTIAHRCFLDEVRKTSRSRVNLTATGELPREPMASLTGEADEHGDSTESPLQVSIADLEGLPHNQKEALILTKVQGHSVAEAAQIVGTSAGAIKLRAHRAYVTLRSKLGQVREAP